MRLVGEQKNYADKILPIMRTKNARVSIVQLMAIFCQIVGHEEAKGTAFAWCEQEIAKVVIFVQLVAISIQIADIEYSTQQKWTR